MNPKSEALNLNPETRTRDPGPETLNSKSEALNLTPAGTRNPKR